MLNAKNLVVRYGGAECIRDVSFTINQGEIVTIIGANGAGKTTVLRTISGLKRAISGEISFQEKNIDQTLPQHIVKMGIGHVPQERDLFPYMTVLENLKLGAYLQKDKKKIQDGLEEIYKVFPILNDRHNQLASTMSGGQQQMLAIARALMGRPSLLLLDEPSTGLAPIIVKEIGVIIKKINQAGTSILLVEQNARLALDLSQRGYVMETGRIVLEGNCQDLTDDDRVKKAYLGK